MIVKYREIVYTYDMPVFKCEGCEDAFTLNQGVVDLRKRSGYPIRFCDMKCKKLFYDKVGRKTRKEIWTKYNQKRQTKIDKRKWQEQKTFDGNITTIGAECKLCGSSKKLVIHHRDGCNGKQGKELNNDKNNLVVLCKHCHPSVHNQWWLKDLKEVVPSND